MRAGLIAKALGAPLLFAFCVGQAWAGPCVAPPVSDQAISEFKANPQAIVAPDADTRTIEAFVRDLAGSDAAMAGDLVRLAEGTTPRFQTAIAAGLAQAAIACSNVDQQAALLIQQAVASFENGEFQNSFAAVAGDLSTAATAAAESSATGSVGSVTITNPVGFVRPTTNPGGGGATQFVQITAGPAAITSTLESRPTSTTTTAANPVSTTR
jgi:hypothetical protein